MISTTVLSCILNPQAERRARQRFSRQQCFLLAPSVEAGDEDTEIKEIHSFFKSLLEATVRFFLCSFIVSHSFF